MAINVKFDLAGNPEPPTILLANRSGNILGQLDVETESIDMSDRFNDASEFSFTLYKYVDDKITNLWDKVVDFKLVYCKEWDTWFEIKVELDESTETVKTVFCTQLEKAELSQLNLYGVEINTEKDIERDDYKISILYDGEDADASILHRLLRDKAPHYSIVHVDSTIAKIQRSFSFDGTSIDDAFQDIAKEIGCVFIYHTYKDDDGILRRTISVYDLQQNCNNCGHRAEFTDVCPKCNSTDITYGYGEDTLIFVTSDELASDGIELVTDTDAVKNCFKLEAGDDLMTATVRSCNPNGSDYIWYFSNFMKDDMSDELVEKLKSYDALYQYHYSDKEYNINSSLLSKFNNLVDKYSTYNEDLQKITVPIKGYSSLTNALYNTIDLELYLQSALMPSVKMSGTNAKEQAKLLTSSTLSPVAVANVEIVSLATANSAVLSMAKTVVRPTYKIQVENSELLDQGETKYWRGNFIVTSYSDEEDTATSSTITVVVNDDLETSIKQQIERMLNKEKSEDYSIVGLFEKSYSDFCAELKKYALNPLDGFYKACQSCIDILIEQGVGEEENDLYDGLYLPYYNKLGAIEAEMQVRENEINIITDVQAEIEKRQIEVRNELDFKKYLGDKLWIEFCSYRRDDVYSNDNYISDGLNNAEIFERAMEFFESAENEIFKSSELQNSISTTLNNLLAIPKFKSLVEHFKVGNWLRVQVDDSIFKLRLLEYNINYGDFDNISVEFSDVVKIKNGITDVQSILDQARSMATSYDSVQRQATKGNNAKESIDSWLSEGLNSALVRITGNDNEDISLDKNGLLCRSYDDITNTYLPEQFRLTHNIMAYTTDNWKTVSAALGKHDYVYFDDDDVKQIGTDYGLTAKFVTAGYINGSQIIGGEIYSSNYEKNKSGTYFNLIDGDFELADGKFVYNNEDSKLSVRDVAIDWNTSTNPDIEHVIGLTDSLNGLSSRITINKNAITSEVARATEAEGNLSSRITQTAEKIELKVSKDSIISSINQSAESITINANKISLSGKTINLTSDNIVIKSTNFSVDKNGVITAKSGEIGGWTIGTYKIYGGDKNTGVCVMQRPTSTNTYVFAAGGTNHEGYGDCPFRVRKDGKLYASGAEISGNSSFSGSLSAATGSFAGRLSAVTGTFTSLSAGNSTFSAKQVKIATPSGKASDGAIYIGDSGVSGWEDITIRPSSDNLGNIGTGGKSWDILYVRDGAVNSSDRRLKKEITVMGDKQEQLFNLLSPVTYKFIDSKNDRTHYGFISQEVEDAILECGLETKDFAGFCKNPKQEDDGTPILDENGNQDYKYLLRYTEFIALNTHMIKKLQAENKELKERLDLLENKLQ
jgi:peptidyl-tRNA hydrolase